MHDNRHDMPDLPDFLRIDQRTRAEAWGRKRLRSTRDMMFKVEKKDVPADVLKFMREEEKRRKEKQAAVFAMLRERAALKRKQGVR